MASRGTKRRRSKKLKKRTYYLLWRMVVSVMVIIIGIAWLSQMTLSLVAQGKEVDSRENQAGVEADVELLTKAPVEEDMSSYSESEREIAAYANTKGYRLSDYSDKLIELYEKNEDARQFVLDYPLKKDIDYTIDLSEYKNAETVPLLMQWDERWGYRQYAGNVFGLTGCGPACLSMVAIYITGNDTLNPGWMADFSVENGYYEEGNGTRWALMSEGASMLGLNVKEISLDEERIVENLLAGNPIICIMGPGDFTDSGHFIVLTGYKDGGFTINDPNSYQNSQKIWTFHELQNQVRGLWVYWK